MQNQNMQPWAWGQAGAPSFPGGPVFQPPFSPAMDQSQLMTGYQQMYGAAPSQPPSDYGASQWSAAQIQHWQQWQQWQEKYQQWQAQYGKKYAESIAAMGQNPGLMLPGVPPVTDMMKPSEGVTNPGYTTVNPPPPPSNAQPVPPPPPDEEKPSGPAKGGNKSKTVELDAAKESQEELSEAEKTFDVQFKLWEDQFNEWKKQNQDHPDKAQYREYEKKWETWREQLLQRREQMRKKRLSKSSDLPSDNNNLVAAKGDDSKLKPAQGQNQIQGKTVEMECGYKTAVQNTSQHPTPSNADSKFETKAASVSCGPQDGQGLYSHQKPRHDLNMSNSVGPVNPAGNFGSFPDGNFPNLQDSGRIPGSFDRENPNFGIHAPMYGPPASDGGREKEFSGPRFPNLENSGLGEFPQRRQFGNGNYDEDRNFGPRFPPRKDFGPDRFADNRAKDQKFNSGGRGGDFDSGLPINDQPFNPGARCFPEKNFPEMKPPFNVSGPNLSKSNFGNSSFKPKVPSLFEITVEKPPGLMSPGKERKPKVWEKHEKDNFFEAGFDDKKDEKNRNDKPWMGNSAWPKNNSPWIKPWELDRVMAEKAPDANLRTDAWQKESLAGGRDDKPWSKDLLKPDIDKTELSGYVGNILAKLGSFNVIPSMNLAAKEGNAHNSGKINESLDNKLQSMAHAPNWPNRESQPGRDHGKGDHPMFGKEGQNNFGGNFGRDRETGKFSLNEQRNSFGQQSGPEDVVLFGKGDCDDRFRFDRDQFRGSFCRDDRNFDQRSPFRREERGPFQEDPGRGGPLAQEDDRFKLERNCRDYRDDRPKFNPDDVDERMGRNRNRRRVFDDREERNFRGGYDRDERRRFGGNFNFGRNPNSNKEQEWNPQVFDYCKGPQQGFRGRFSNPEENFHISTVVDYSHGENKQTFDYAHGEAKAETLGIKSFDYGHGGESTAVIDYGHGSDRDAISLQQWRKNPDGKGGERDRSRSKSKSPPRRSWSPRIRPRSRSRSPLSVGSRTRRDSNSPSFRGHRSRSKDRFNRPMPKRNHQNSSEEKPLQNADGDISKNNFDVTTVLVEDLICSPGRETRPNKLVFIMRGLPGSGKTYVTKLIKDKEVEMGGDAPRILSLDDYFMTEVEKEVVDEETGRKTKKKVLEYEYESCAEPHYRGSLLKAFKKTISDGFFSFIIVDSVNERTKDYEEMWSFAKQKGFQVYVAEMDDDVAVCTKRNIHKRTEKEISDLTKIWEKTPNHYLRLDVRSFLQADAITEVEMEVVSDTDNEKQKETEKECKEDEEEDEPGESAFVKSRWDHFENSEQKLDRLDGLKRRREGFHATMEDYLQLPDDFDVGSAEPTDGKKKVRWADLEERRQQEKMRAIGFVVGQTDWSRMTDPTFGESALTRTKYI